MDTLYKDLLGELECPVCTTHMLPPIIQCVNGHSVCATCRGRLTQCPICLDAITDMRNFTLEKLASKMALPCTNKEQGCPINLPLEEKLKHEKVCSFRGIPCEMVGCSWSGKEDDLQAHWESKKQSVKMYVDSHVCKAKVKSNSNFVNLMKAQNKLFWFKCRTGDDYISWAVQTIGKDVDPSTYFFEVEIFKPDMNRRKLVLSEYCSASGDSVDVFAGSNVCSLPIDCLNRYLENDETLVYRVTVKFVKYNPGPKNANNEQKVDEVNAEHSMRSIFNPGLPSAGSTNPFHKNPYKPNQNKQNRPNKNPNNPQKNKQHQPNKPQNKPQGKNAGKN